MLVWRESARPDGAVLGIKELLDALKGSRCVSWCAAVKGSRCVSWCATVLCVLVCCLFEDLRTQKGIFCWYSVAGAVLQIA